MGKTAAIIAEATTEATNSSVLLEGGAPRPCPMYDVVSTMVWPRYDSRLAMAVNGREDPSDVGLADWRAEAVSCGVDPDAAEASVRDMAARLADALPAAEASLGRELGGRLHEVVAHTTARLSADLGFRVAAGRDAPAGTGMPRGRALAEGAGTDGCEAPDDDAPDLPA